MVASDVLVGIGNATWSGTPRIVSWHPMAVVYDKFLTEEECDYILKLSKPRMEPAMLVNSKEQKHQRSKSRTSHGAFLDSFEDDVLSMITNRIAHVAKVPPGEFTDADPPSGLMYASHPQHLTSPIVFTFELLFCVVNTVWSRGASLSGRLPPSRMRFTMCELRDTHLGIMQL